LTFSPTAPAFAAESTSASATAPSPEMQVATAPRKAIAESHDAIATASHEALVTAPRDGGGSLARQQIADAVAESFLRSERLAAVLPGLLQEGLTQVRRSQPRGATPAETDAALTRARAAISVMVQTEVAAETAWFCAEARVRAAQAHSRALGPVRAADAARLQCASAAMAKLVATAKHAAATAPKRGASGAEVGRWAEVSRRAESQQPAAAPQSAVLMPVSAAGRAALAGVHAFWRQQSVFAREYALGHWPRVRRTRLSCSDPPAREHPPAS